MSQDKASLTSRLSEVKRQIHDCISRFESVTILMESGKFDDGFIIIRHLMPEITRGFYLIFADIENDELNNADFLNIPVAFEAKALLLQTTEKINSEERLQLDRAHVKEIEEDVRTLISQLGRAGRTFGETVDAQAIKRRRNFLFRIFTIFSVALILWAGYHFTAVYMEKRHLNGGFTEWMGDNTSGAPSNAAGTGPKNWEFVTAGGSAKIERIKFAREQYHVPGNPQFSVKWTLTKPADYAYMENRFDNIKMFAGEKIVLSFWAKVAEGNMNFSSNAYQLPTGVLDNTAIMINPSVGSPFTLTPNWQKVSIEYRIPVVDEKIVMNKSYFLIRPLFFSNKDMPTVEIASLLIDRSK